ncbi:YggT family protein [Actinomyces sp. B33]|uniref:YggT family protein n=1 Tax=Actinomyces sp. B33 TaxID=2942131 RepID=UPI00234021CD|nr:YggT family protein [Actinomyces sp. B33]MDC4233088.1 YggT family protein [Actinomyces sp. B33]
MLAIIADLISLIGGAIRIVAGLYLLVLIVRMILDWVRLLSPSWRPAGVLLPVANALYWLTDPPLRFLRRYIPPLRLSGGVSLDVGFMVLFLAVLLVRNIGGALQAMF